MIQTALIVLAGICAWFILLVRADLGFRRFLFLLPFLPTYFAVRIAGVAITSARLAVAFVLLSALLREPDRFRFRLHAPDLCLGAYLMMLVLNVGLTPEGIQYSFGQIMDIGVPYLIVRMFVRTLGDLSAFLHALIAPATLIAGLAAIQYTTGYNIFTVFKQGSSELGLGVYEDGMVRQGRNRADVGLCHYIMLGVYFAILMPLAYAHFRSLGYSSKKIMLRLVVFVVGIVSSISGGAMLAGAIAMGFVLMWPFRNLWILAVLGFATLVTYVEIFSNRSFLTVLASYSATDASSAYYRVSAPEVWMNVYLPGHWMFGFGLDIPHMGEANDITNHYFGIIFLGGLTMLAPFVATFVAGFVCLKRAATIAGGHVSKISWSIAASMTSLLAVMVTVSFFGQVVSVLWMILALPASVLAAVSKAAAEHADQELVPRASTVRASRR